ncbi:unnamed protein product [Psylliodes chrysocephalus]|uniref:SCAN domain-containing protein 3 n=1 Tax=Psylliodes chrysocephalus TaxID=3402493 RepID=A0A9P0CB61_9CUCU|nr:unnamed protein product [Psylliodes chrysocephala]
MLQDDVILSYVTLERITQGSSTQTKNLSRSSTKAIESCGCSSTLKQYSVLWNIAQKYLIAFPSSYLVEKGFSVVTNILTKQRNRLKINEREDLRLQLINIEPDLARFVESHQVHPSHQDCQV